jgi:hypothetical protein
MEAVMGEANLAENLLASGETMEGSANVFHG